MITENTIQTIKERRDKVLKGGLNVIPSPFLRFRNDFPGIEQSSYMIVTSFTKGGKTQFVSNLLFESLIYCYNNKDKGIKLKVLYFALEETKEKIMLRFISWLLNKEKNIKISPAILRSINPDKVISKEILEIIESNDIMPKLKYFEQHFEFYDDTTADAIIKRCENYAKRNGEILKYMDKYVTPEGIVLDIERVNKYKPNDENEYVVPVIDTINLVDTKDGFTKKMTIDQLSENLAKVLRNKYNQSPIVIQQQNAENESSTNVRLGRCRPDVKGLGDSKYPSHDCDIMIGIFSPYKFGLKEYYGYDIERMRDHFRMIEVVVNRNGEMGGIIGMCFDGRDCEWIEMPRPTNEESLDAMYKYIDNLNTKQ